MLGSSLVVILQIAIIDLPRYAETPTSTTHKNRIYPVPSLSMKVFSNMKRSTKGFSGQEVALFPNMLDVTEPSTSPSRITSSPSPTPSPEPTPAHTPSPTQPSLLHNHHLHNPQILNPSPTHPSPTQLEIEHHSSNTMSHLSIDVHSHGSDEGVKKLESQIKTGKVRRQGRVVLSDDEVFEDDSSKQGRKFSDEGVQEKSSTDTVYYFLKKDSTEVISRSKRVRKRSRQDKGKAILIEEEPKKKSKKELEQERLSYVEAIRLEEQMNEEQRAQIAMSMKEIARTLG
ncbi:hypothetical protein Tco_0336896 [Tanacetum coccineum]